MMSRPFARPLHHSLGKPLHTKLRSADTRATPVPRPFATPLARKLRQPLKQELRRHPGAPHTD